jgi:hypothetical protein
MKRYLLIIYLPGTFIRMRSPTGCNSLDNRLSQVEITSAKLDKLLTKTTSEFESKLANFGEDEFDIRSQTAALNVKIDNMREELQVLNGQLEEIHHQLNQGTNIVDVNQLQEMVAYQNERLLRVEKYLNLESAEKKPSRPSQSDDKARKQRLRKMNLEKISQILIFISLLKKRLIKENMHWPGKDSKTC